MTEKAKKPLRCAIYTRKSTEHGLELEFNSLDAQREACEAYIKSQTQEGWSALAKRYDDPAFSGGNLERPALQKLLNDIDTGQVNVVVVYKIDRLTRSLADFAKLVERFDAKGVSFVAVTQQFSTTTSMGRLTLNVLLSFAQFERELSSERVRDKVAASRQKGKWTGGGVPLGYDIKDKKLAVNESEAAIVRAIFERYLALKSLRLLKSDLDAQRIVSKRRKNLSGETTGGVPMTYGPLAYLLKNRTYLGEMGHKGKWFAGEHRAIISPALFDSVQDVMKKNSIDRRQRRSNASALLAGVLFDDRGNRMTPSYTSKNGVRYRFYVSSAVLSGRGDQNASVRRVPAAELESAVVASLRQRFMGAGEVDDQNLVGANVERIVLNQGTVSINLKSACDPLTIKIAWPTATSARATIEHSCGHSDENPDLALLNAVARAQAWRKALADGRYKSVEDLAKAAQWHPKVMRKALRIAFLAPDVVEAILRGGQRRSLSLSELQALSTWSWAEQRRALDF